MTAARGHAAVAGTPPDPLVTGLRPVPSSTAVQLRMSRQRSRDTGVELALRALLHRRGLRYRIHKQPVPGLRRTADCVFTRARVALFVDGCFWHGCPEHYMEPHSNSGYWAPKIAGNQRRDAETDAQLERAGWLSVRIWEHADLATAADRLAEVVRARAAPHWA